MYVLEVTNIGTTDETISGVLIPAGDKAHFPADRCVWKYENAATGGSVGGYVDSLGQYRINNARFFPGNEGSVDLWVSGRLTVVLGTIGKSGRFVGMTV